MIIKIQSSLNSSDGVRRCLIYNEERDVNYETEDPVEVTALLEALDGKPKAYFVAEVVDSKLRVVDRAEDQSW